MNYFCSRVIADRVIMDCGGDALGELHARQVEQVKHMCGAEEQYSADLTDV